MAASPYRTRRPGMSQTAADIYMPLILGHLVVAWLLAVAVFTATFGGLSAYQIMKRGVDFVPVHNLTMAWGLLANWPTGVGLGAVGLIAAIAFYIMGA